MLLGGLGHAQAGTADTVGGDVLAQLERRRHHCRADLTLRRADHPIDALRELWIQGNLCPQTTVSEIINPALISFC